MFQKMHLFLLVLFLLGAIACTLEIDYTPSKFSCRKNTDCFANFECRCLGGGTYCFDEKNSPGQCIYLGVTDGGVADQAPKQCKVNTDCNATETCKPDSSGLNGSCVPTCNVAKENECVSGQVCVLNGNRGYCVQKSGKKGAKQLCTSDVECELNLFCRSVQGFTRIKRCSEYCDQNAGCFEKGQSCKSLRPENTPYGYCEVLPTKGQKGDICTPSGDLLCASGLTCTRDTDGQYRCK